LCELRAEDELDGNEALVRKEKLKYCSPFRRDGLLFYITAQF